MLKRNQKGFAHFLLLLLILVVLSVMGFAAYKVAQRNRAKSYPVNYSAPANTSNSSRVGTESANSTDPIAKGKFLADGHCSGSGSKMLTHALMDPKNIDDIQPMGLMVGGHVTPVDHEYYTPAGGQNSPPDAYPVYADGNGIVAVIEYANDGTKTAWWLTVAHSCTFLSNYNLMTSLAPDIKAKITPGAGDHWRTNVNIPVKAGELIGYVGHQTLDFQVWDTTKTLQGLLYPIAYNNREPWKINTVSPLDYFTPAVKAQILPKYMRTAQPLDGKIDYDTSGEAVGNWFLKGSNGYAGGDDPGSPTSYTGHLALAYDYLDPAAMVFSIGDYQGQPKQFTVVDHPTDWQKITPASGMVEYRLAPYSYIKPDGSGWMGGFVQGLKVSPNQPMATALIQLVDKDDMEVEVFPGKTPGQVAGFDSGVKMYNRGQDAHLIQSSAATH